MKISLVTPTCDRPVAFELCEKLIARQTRQPDEWIVADGGAFATRCTFGQIHIYDPRPPGAVNFGRNLLNGIQRASGDLVIIIEDDDWLAPTHLERMIRLAESRPDAWLIGSDDIQAYYNVAARVWRTFNNVGASLCQTGMRASVLRSFGAIINHCLERNSYGIDTMLWRQTPRDRWAIAHELTVLGIKGLPGRAGLGVGHRPGVGWTPDADLAKLRSWIGDDAELYAGFALPRAA
jgi:glycosyltransferase involved in cell wall biosynthesis